jgi:hypothetical protein
MIGFFGGRSMGTTAATGMPFPRSKAASVLIARMARAELLRNWVSNTFR